MALVNIVFSYVTESLLPKSASVSLTAIFILLLWLTTLPLNVWQYVGVWRSGRRYLLEGGERIWGHAARSSIAIFAVATAVATYNVAIPQLREALTMLRGDPEVEDFQVTLLASGREIEFKGGLKRGAAERVKVVLDSAPNVTLFRVESMGGRLSEALAIAKLIEKRKLNTYVGRYCASAGVILFLAGKERIIVNTAGLGFHSGYFPGVPANITNEEFEARLRRVGADSSFINKALGTVQPNLWSPDIETLLQAKVATRVTTEDEFGLGSSEIAQYSEETVKQELMHDPLYTALSKARPKEFEEAVRAIVQEVRLGKTIPVASESVNLLLRTTAAQMWPTACDEAVDLWLDCTIKLIVDNMDLSPRDVLLRLNSDPELMIEGAELLKRLPKYPADEEKTLTATLLRGRSTPVDKSKIEEAEKLFEELFATTFKDSAEGDFWEAPVPTKRAEQYRYCQLTLRLYQAIKARPMDERVLISRVFLPRE